MTIPPPIASTSRSVANPDRPFRAGQTPTSITSAATTAAAAVALTISFGSNIRFFLLMAYEWLVADGPQLLSGSLEADRHVDLLANGRHELGDAKVGALEQELGR